MTSRVRLLVFVLTGLVASAILTYPALAAGKMQTLTGEVSDAMCGRSHMMEGSKADCTRACAHKGSKYSLVVGEKVYDLESSDKTALDTLEKLAGEQATVTGSVNGDTMTVKSVTAKK